MHPASRFSTGTPVLIALAWSALAALYALRLALFTSVAPFAAVLVSAMAMAVVAALGGGIAWLVSRLPWLTRPGLKALLLHPVLATLFSLAWIVALVTAARLVVRAHVFSGMGWELLIGYLLYLLAVVAGLAMLSSSRLAGQREVAARAEELAAQARAAAVRARMNPHFLFNTLHSIGALAGVDPEAAGRAIEQLGDLLRHALESSPADVTLAAEWRFTSSYIELERLRLGERLDLVAELEPAAHECLVPAFILQPLVENAIVHGIAPRPGRGLVRIAARVAGDELLIGVTDDGVGAEAAALGSSTGFGLRAVRERLALIGAPAPEVVTSPQSGFAVTVRLPRRPAAAVSA